MQIIYRKKPLFMILIGYIDDALNYYSGNRVKDCYSGKIKCINLLKSAIQ